MLRSAAIVREEYDGVPVHVSRAPGRPLIFLLRMIALETGIWDAVWAHLAGRFTVANFNFFETEAAQHMASPAEGFARFARHCVGLAAQLGHETFHLLGWVGGTQVAMRCAIDFPDRVRSCTLLNPHFPLSDMRPVEIGNRFKQAILEKDDELYAYYWVMSGLYNGFIERNFDVVKRLVDARLAADRFVRSGSERFMQWARALRTQCVSEEELGLIRVPTLVIGAELERWNAGPGPEMAKRLHARIPGAGFALLDGVGELAPVEAPWKLFAALDPFLERVA